ncbi:3',5'-cyclic adenosine monophosphate phosphodiesterase CpdA [uncultured archaeon]|nr:3',5'-cyclic adenosine monophosphate phosphodiesterase CpdA [uncultured archaeon]
MKLRKELIFFTLIITSFAGALGTAQPSSEPIDVNASAVPDHITLSWTDNPMTTQTVTWRTDGTVQTGVVQYGMDRELKDNAARSVAAQVSRLKTELGDENIFTAKLTNLEAGTRYYYKVGDHKSNWSPVYSFRTEENDTNRFQFLIFGDTQSGNDKKPDYSLWQSTVQNAYKANPDANFFVLVGDAAQAGRSAIHWDYWFAACKGVIDSISYMPVEGNTETRDINKTHGEATLYINQFKVPHNGPYNNSEAYSYDYGNVHFVVLDSQLHEKPEINPNLLNEQKAWLEKDLSQTNKEWKVVFWHKPPYSIRSYHTYNAIKAAFTPIIDKYHVDMVFNGHDHAYCRTYPINNDSIVSSPALGTVYIIAGRSGAKYLNDIEPKVWSANFFDPQDMPNYLVVDVNGSRMEIKNCKMDGTLVDDYIIDKTGSDMQRTAVPPKYNNPKLVVNGVLLNKPMMPTTPSQINSKWYFPIKPVVAFLGGSESVSGENETLSLIVNEYDSSKIWSDEEVHTVILTNASTKATIDEARITLPDSVVIDSGKNFLISADDMNVLFGFTWKYDSERNILSLINPSEFGE